MKICIYGAGAIGSLIGSELARAGHQVTLIGRGPHLAAMNANGLTVRMNGGERHTRPACTEDAAEAGVQDLVIFVLKAHQVAIAAEHVGPLLGPKTPVVAAQNGIPWWYFHKSGGGGFEDHVLNAVDPDRCAWRLIGPGRVIGAVINGSCVVVEPGVVEHHQKTRALMIGEPDGTRSARCLEIVDAFAATDFEIPITENIRLELWTKLLSNVGLSMICVLTRSTLGEVNNDAACFALSKRLMAEMALVSGRLGVDLDAAVATRIASQPVSNAHKPSTLQDLELGRPMEIDAMVGAVIEMGRMVDQPTPYLDAIYALLRRLAEKTGTYPPNPAFAPEIG